MNYHNKKFRPVSTTESGEVSKEVIFHYQQDGDILSCSYSGPNIILGHLLGLVDKTGHIDMRYHQINRKGELRTGICRSTPRLLDNGKIRLSEEWEWTSGEKGKGQSLLEEI